MAALIGISVKPKDGAGGYSCDVPLDLLAEDGVPPEQGDKVSYSVDGTVTAVDGNSATIKIDAVNGQPVGDVPDTGPETSTPPSTGSMRDALAQGAKGQPMPF